MEKFVIHPEQDPDSKPFWDHLREHDAELQKCGNCDRFRYPPYPSCPFCGTLGGEWMSISGNGKVMSWIIIHHPIDPSLASEVPFLLALIELEEGPRVLGRLDIEHDKVKMDMPVHAYYEDVDEELTLMNFRPVA